MSIKTERSSCFSRRLHTFCGKENDLPPSWTLSPSAPCRIAPHPPGRSACEASGTDPGVGEESQTVSTSVFPASAQHPSGWRMVSLFVLPAAPACSPGWRRPGRSPPCTSSSPSPPRAPPPPAASQRSAAANSGRTREEAAAMKNSDDGKETLRSGV